MDDSSIMIKPFRVLEEPPELLPPHPGKQHTIQEDLNVVSEGRRAEPGIHLVGEFWYVGGEAEGEQIIRFSHLLPAVITEGKSGKISILEIFGIQLLPHRKNLK